MKTDRASVVTLTGGQAYIVSVPRFDEKVVHVRSALPAKHALLQNRIIRDIAGHRLILRQAFERALSNVSIVSPFIRENALDADDVDRRIRDATCRGVVVTVYTDRKLNKAAQSFEGCLERVQRAGARIFLATKSGVHTKLLWSDDNLLAIGSFNWLSAVRSDHPYRRYEISAIYRGAMARQLIKAIRKDLDDLCTRYPDTAAP